MADDNNALEKLRVETKKWLKRVKYEEDTYDVLLQMTKNAVLRKIFKDAVKEAGDDAAFQTFAEQLAREKEKRFFTNLVKKWLVRDCYTPFFKAGAVLNTLLSEYIEDLLENMVREEYKEELAADEKESTYVKLLAKEFPVAAYTEKGEPVLDTIDYVAYTTGARKKLFLVELKTAAESFEENQLRNYLRFSGRSIDEAPLDSKGKPDSKQGLFAFYQDKCRCIEPGTYRKAKAKDKAFRLKDNQKYIFQLKRMYSEIQSEFDWKKKFDGKLKKCRTGEDVEKVLDAVFKEITEFFRGYTVCVVYITLTPLASNKNSSKTAKTIGGIYNIVLDENIKSAEEERTIILGSRQKGKVAVHMYQGFDYLPTEVMKNIIRGIKSRTIDDEISEDSFSFLTDAGWEKEEDTEEVYDDEEHVDEEGRTYCFYLKEPDDKVWWVGHFGLRADFLEISFDKKKIYNLWEDYPDKLTPEEKELFEKENPYWALRLASEKEND